MENLNNFWNNKNVLITGYKWFHWIKSFKASIKK